MSWNVLMILIVLPVSGNCAVSYTYNSHNGLNMVKEGTPVMISCYFKGDKPPGTSRWTLKRELVALDCTPHNTGVDIITPTTHCRQDIGDGYANYSFIIHQVSLDRDRKSWVCRNFNLDEPLDLPITIRGIGTTGNAKSQYRNEEYLTITANVGCSYPPADILWCLDDGTDVKCSDQSDWFAGVLERSPAIAQTTEVCTNYRTPNVSKYQSRIEGKITNAQSNARYQLYYRLNGIDYKGDTVHITWMSKEDIYRCGILSAATVVVEALNISLMMVTIMYLVMIQRKGPTSYSLFPSRTVFWVVDIILLSVSSTLCISNMMLCNGKL